MTADDSDMVLDAYSYVSRVAISRYALLFRGAEEHFTLQHQIYEAGIKAVDDHFKSKFKESTPFSWVIKSLHTPVHKETVLKHGSLMTELTMD